jgi:hypothetical protein
MSENQERLEGVGALQRDAGGPPAQVKYSFLMRRWTERTRLGTPLSKSEGRGSIEATAPAHFREGFYRLVLSDGAQVRVQRAGGDWYLLGGS